MSDIDDSALEDDEEELDDDAVDFSDVTGDEPVEAPALEDNSPEARARKAEIEAAAARAEARAFEKELERRRDEANAQAETQRRLEATRQEDVQAPQPRKSLRTILQEKVPDIGNKFVMNPEETLGTVLDVFEQELDSRTRAPRGQDLALIESTIANFARDQREANPEEYALANKIFKERFDALPAIDKLRWVNAPPGAVRAALQTEWDGALGKATRLNAEEQKKKQQQRRAAPPPPSGGRTSGAVGGGVKRGRPMSAVERATYDSCINMGLSVKDAQEAVNELRAELKGAS